jgi:hypothetical protein
MNAALIDSMCLWLLLNEPGGMNYLQFFWGAENEQKIMNKTRKTKLKN